MQARHHSALAMSVYIPLAELGIPALYVLLAIAQGLSSLIQRITTKNNLHKGSARYENRYRNPLLQ